MIDRLYPGGTESQLVALIRHFDPARVRPYLCLLDGEDAVSRSMEPDNCPVLRLGVRVLRRPQSVPQAWRLAQFLRRERIDVLQLYFPDSTYFGVPVGRFAGVPYILRTRNNLNHWMTPVHRRLGRWLNRLVTVTVANSEPCRQAVLADESPPPSSVVVLENGVDLGPFLAIPPVGPVPRTGGRRVGVVANLRPVKGIASLVEAAALLRTEHPHVTFHVAGDGEARAALEARIAALNLTDRFFLAGTVRDVPAFLATLDVAVLPSLAEGMSNAVLEYMAAGRPIVATAVGGTLQQIADGVHGLLVPPGRPALLAAGIGRLLRDAATAARLGAAARQRARERYGRDVMVQSFEAFYRRLVWEGKTLVN